MLAEYYKDKKQNVCYDGFYLNSKSGLNINFLSSSELIAIEGVYLKFQANSLGDILTKVVQRAWKSIILTEGREGRD